MKNYILFVLSVYSLAYASYPEGTTLLMIVSTEDNAESFFDLIATTTDPKINAQNSLGQTALLCAIESNHPLYVAVLLAMGANQNIKDNKKQDAFVLAKQSDNPDLALILPHFSTKPLD